MARTKKTPQLRQQRKDRDYQLLRREQYIRAATVLVEKVLRFEPDTPYSVEDIAANGMIRKRYIVAACIAHPHVNAVQTKSKSNAMFKWVGPPSNHNFRGRAPIREKDLPQ